MRQQDKANDGVGDRIESAGNKTAQPSTSDAVDGADTAAERAGDADNTAKAADVDGEEEPAASKKRPEPIQLPDLYRPELKPPEAIS